MLVSVTGPIIPGEIVGGQGNWRMENQNLKDALSLQISSTEGALQLYDPPSPLILLAVPFGSYSLQV